MQQQTTPATPAKIDQSDAGATPPALVPQVQLQSLSAQHRLALRPSGRTWVKRSIWVIVAAALAITLALGLRPKPVPVETANIETGTLVVSVNEDGRTRVKDRYLISAPLAGTVTRLTLRPGDVVDRDAVVARLMPSAPPLLNPRSRAEAQARVAAAQATLNQAGSGIERARAAYGYARREAERQRSLLRAGATAAQIEEQAELAEQTHREELASAEFAQRVAASELRLARAALVQLGSTSSEQLIIRSPVHGRVLRVLQESEGTVQPGAPLVEIGDPNALEIVVDVLTTDAVEIHPGAPVRIERWGGDSALSGRVRRIEPSAFTRLSALGVEEQRVNVIVDPDGAPRQWAALGDGYRVEASITVWTGTGKLLVPGGAVFRQGEGWATYVVEKGRAHLRPVQLGRRNSSQIEVLSGLRPGEPVVLYPTDKVHDGVRAALR
jgi:HlyD family secretion protein